MPLKIPITSFDPGVASDVPIEDLERREREEAIINFFERAFHILNDYQSHQGTVKQWRMSSRAMQLALGFHLAAGADSPEALARNCHVDKWTMGKCILHFMEQLKLEPLPCQRNHKDRENMSIARKLQVTV